MAFVISCATFKLDIQSYCWKHRERNHIVRIRLTTAQITSKYAQAIPRNLLRNWYAVYKSYGKSRGIAWPYCGVVCPAIRVAALYIFRFSWNSFQRKDMPLFCRWPLRRFEYHIGTRCRLLLHFIWVRSSSQSIRWKFLRALTPPWGIHEDNIWCNNIIRVIHYLSVLFPDHQRAYSRCANGFYMSIRFHRKPRGAGSLHFWGKI